MRRLLTLDYRDSAFLTRWKRKRCMVTPYAKVADICQRRAFLHWRRRHCARFAEDRLSRQLEIRLA